ncbi:pitrilysin family protein [Amycolatopsis sp. NPDC021455]|uniref:M16 family metallopeptidase n=1 Tax=Amycolatopsis sp. NPDC021455 TaxID=3154901 RepID=UPI0033CAD92C
MNTIIRAGRRYQLAPHVLPNGLRVLVAPDHDAEVVAATVVYDVGSRSEPRGFSGFAHLFEHLMFQGSANLPRGAHAHYVQSCGGVFNGTTHLDYTEYYQVLPSSGVEHAVFLEADRMRAPSLTEASLANQIDVVAEEITGAIVSRPYGGFPWLQLAPLVFDTFENAHNGYGAIEELRTATTGQAHAFFEQYYAPANAVLCLAGDVSADRGIELAERYFSDIPARRVPRRPVIAEPDLTAERRDSSVDPLAPLPVFASAWRVPDPAADLRGYLAYLVVCLLLTDSALGRLFHRLVRRDRWVSSVDCSLGLTGEVFGVRDPTCLVLTASPVPGGPGTDAILKAVDEEAERLATEGPSPAELTAATRTISAQLVRMLDGLAGRARLLAVFALQHGDAGVINELGPLSRAVTTADIRAAAATLRPDRRATVELHPGAAR